MTVIRYYILLSLLTVSIIDALSQPNPRDFDEAQPPSDIAPDLSNFFFEPAAGVLKSQAVVENQAKNEDYRLPKNIVPEFYKLKLTIPKEIFENEQSNVFSGTVKFTFTVKEDTSEIKLHANFLKIEDTTLVEALKNSTKIDLNEKSYDSDLETDIIVIKTKSKLSRDKKYKLSFKYEGQIRSSSEMLGLYKSYYEDRDGTTKYMVTTQFETHSARKMFPCLDEPSFKAIFEISITHPKTLNAFSNTEISKTEDSGESVITTFKKTSKMSTYLVAIIISEFTCTAGTNLQGNLKYEVCSRDEVKDTRDYAAEIGPKILKSLGNFTGIDFSESRIGKMHCFAIPDFEHGAMENWGLVTYREAFLLYDKLKSSNQDKQTVAAVLAHEFAHQWFGNLITTHWWSDTFLNEGFATYFQFFTTHEVEAKWELDKHFVIDNFLSAMENAATSKALPLSHPVFTPEDLTTRFNPPWLSYHQGGSVIRMIDLTLEHENFKKGIQKYLADNKFSNTQPSDLIEALNEFVPRDRLPKGTNLQTVLKNWIEKPGFPLVSVKIDGSNLKLSQQRYLRVGKPSKDEKWYVPITLTTSKDRNKFQKTTPDNWLLPTEDLTIHVNNLAYATTWVVLNNQQAGFYRVDYDDDLWKRIEDALKRDKFGEIGELNRAQIVHDIFNLAKDGQQSFAKVFDIFDYLENEESFFVWKTALIAMSKMLTRTSVLKQQEKLRSRFLAWLDNVRKSVPFSKAKDDDQIYTLKRVLIQKYFCILGNKECIQNALDAFKNYKANKKNIDNNLKPVIYCEGLRHSKIPKKDFDFLWGKYRKIKLSSEQKIILEALGCSKDPEVLKKLFDLMLEASFGIRAQDVALVCSSIYKSNPENVDISLDYIIKNHEKISRSRVSLEKLISGVADKFTSAEQIEKLRKFGNTQGLSESVKNTIELSTKKAERTLAWQTKFEGSVREALEREASTPPAVTKSSNTRLSAQLELVSCLFVSLLLYFKFTK